MPYFEIDTPAGVLGFDIKDNNATLSAVRGRDVSVDIPETVTYLDKEYPVTTIGRKAFLSDKYVHEISVPDSVTTIGDWGFANCSSLERISLHRNINLNNGVFKSCNSLKQVVIREETIEETSAILAAVIELLDDRYLFDLTHAGSEEWFENWDKRMDVILSEYDDEGFTALLACGEEDYEGRDNTLETYLSERRKRKVRICMVRLLNRYNLSSEREKRLKDYLYEHRAGTTYIVEEDDTSAFTDDGHMGRMHIKRAEVLTADVSAGRKIKNAAGKECPQDETWQVVLNEHGDEQEYYELMCECGCVEKDNLNGMLEDMGDRHARMKAFLLRQQFSGASSSYFDDFDL